MRDDTIGRETIHVPRDDLKNDDSIRDATRPSRVPLSPLDENDENAPTTDPTDDDQGDDRDHARGLFRHHRARVAV